MIVIIINEIKIARIWRLNTITVPVIIGVLGFTKIILLYTLKIPIKL